ncbi:hypothetical protein KGF56_003335 [Candida oxycetoniae]|uniref:DUF159-domain-containing protein n=1 Tax=Candida oxycetoniae TaxID=497107 RepID=A0AAI9SW99_9ASCO|nr:uncharacterized protein KGF56_003335 [Candida oxycetoniae]KAI3403905.2 hypothetical protein KGF56_003335 [Candida oxycetoniae]
MCGRFAQGILSFQNIEEIPSDFLGGAVYQKEASRGGTGTSTSTSNTSNTINETSEGVYQIIDVGPSGAEEKVELDLTRVHNYTPSFNIAPTNTALIIYRAKAPPAEDGGVSHRYIFEPAKFGLVPLWAKPQDPKPINEGKDNQGKRYSRELGKHESKYFNCRKESLDQNKSVWNSAKNNRCVIPVQGYFEWQKTKGEKIPYFVHSTTAPIVYLAGLYSHNHNYNENFNVNEEYLSSFTIVTGPVEKTDENSLAWLHARKPILIKPASKAWYDWLDSDKHMDHKLIDETLNTSTNPAYENVEGYRVSKKVGNPNNKSEDILKKLVPNNDSVDSFFSSKNKERGKGKLKTETVSSRDETKPKVKEEQGQGHSVKEEQGQGHSVKEEQGQGHSVKEEQGQGHSVKEEQGHSNVKVKKEIAGDEKAEKGSTGPPFKRTRQKQDEEMPKKKIKKEK